MNDQERADSIKESYAKVHEFDANQVDRILHLLDLKSKCLRNDCSVRIEFNCFEPATTFFWQIALAVDVLLLAQMNEEVAACLDERGPTRALIEEVKQAARRTGVAVPELAISDFPDLFSKRTDFNIGSSFLDFIVGTYSVFEMFMAHIYEKLRPNYPRSGKQEKRVAGLIKKYNEATAEDQENALRDIIKAGGDYVSGAEKIDFVMSKLPSTYARDPAEDRKIIQFYQSARNSIHNLGKSASLKDFYLQTASMDITLLSGRPTFSLDRSDITRLCGELVEIYLAVLVVNVYLGVEAFIPFE